MAARRVERRQFRFPVERGFDFRLTLHGHGWVDLLPFRWEEATSELVTVLAVGHCRSAPSRHSEAARR